MFGKFLKDVTNKVTQNVQREVNVNLDSKYEYYAVISRNGMFYNGDIFDIPLGRGSVRMCSKTDELITKLTAKLTEEIERCNAGNLPYPPKTSLEALKEKYPNNEILTVRTQPKQGK